MKGSHTTICNFPRSLVITTSRRMMIKAVELLYAIHASQSSNRCVCKRHLNVRNGRKFQFFCGADAGSEHKSFGESSLVTSCVTYAKFGEQSFPPFSFWGSAKPEGNLALACTCTQSNLHIFRISRAKTQGMPTVLISRARHTEIRVWKRSQKFQDEGDFF